MREIILQGVQNYFIQILMKTQYAHTHTKMSIQCLKESKRDIKTVLTWQGPSREAISPNNNRNRYTSQGQISGRVLNWYCYRFKTKGKRVTFPREAPLLPSPAPPPFTVHTGLCMKKLPWTSAALQQTKGWGRGKGRGRETLPSPLQKRGIDFLRGVGWNPPSRLPRAVSLPKNTQTLQRRRGRSRGTRREGDLAPFKSGCTSTPSPSEGHTFFKTSPSTTPSGDPQERGM